jgi:hypothetical protein
MEQTAGSLACHDQSTAAAHRAASFAREFLALRDEGWDPDLLEFMRRVPEPLKEEVYETIDRALANPAEARDTHLLPEVEMVVVPPSEDEAPEAGSDIDPEPELEPEPEPVEELRERVAPVPRAEDRWVRAVGRILPYPIRHHMLAEILSTRQELRERAAWPLDVGLRTLRDLLVGLVQYAPLYEPPDIVEVDDQPPAARRSAVAGWLAWRPAGPLLFLGALFGSGTLLALGGILLACAFACLAVVGACGQSPYTKPLARLLNAMLAGTVTALLVTFTCGVLALLLVIASAIFSFGGLATFSVTALLLVSSCALGVITASGWSPRPWRPSRLVRV